MKLRFSLFQNLAIAFVLSQVSCALASTVMISHHGDTNPINAPVAWTASSKNSNVEASAYNDQGTDVWRFYDPGYANNTNSKSASLYYFKTFTETQRNDMLASGWTLSTTMRMPEDDPSTGVLWSPSSDSWLGFGFDLPSTGDTLQRLMFAFMWGRTATGKTTVQLYGAGSTGLRELDSDYHSLKFEYHPSTQQVSVYVDGDYWREYSGTRTSPASAGSTLIYFGDNNSQPNASIARATYFKNVSLVMVPEPSKALLVMLGLAGLGLARRRNREVNRERSGK